MTVIVVNAPKKNWTGDLGAFFDACRAGALATAWHETAHSMQPVKQFGGPSYLTRMYDPKASRPDLARSMDNTQPGDRIKFAGRG